VRDELLGLDPTDYDVATDATPHRVRKIFRNTREVGVAFAVVHARIEGVSVEIATFRSEGDYSDRRRPDVVHFSEPEADAKRRDFTINALFLDPLASADAPEIHGHVIDYVGGMRDLRSRVIRAVGSPDERLAEDHLRALRAVRFAARLGFDVDEATAEAIRAHARELVGVSRERVGDEFRRMLAGAGRGRAVELLETLGLDQPTLGPPFGRAGSPRLIPRLPPSIGLGVCLAALALDRGLELAPEAIDEAARRWRERLCLSNDERNRFVGALHGLRRLRTRWLSEGVAARKRAAVAPWFGDALALLELVEEGASERVREEVERLRRSPGGLRPAPLLTGDLLVEAGFQPGPPFGPILEAVYDAQLEGRVSDREGALELARRLSV